MPTTALALSCTQRQRTRFDWRFRASAIRESASVRENAPTHLSDTETLACAADPELKRAFTSPIPLRCPRHLVTAGLYRVPGLHSPEAITALREGEAFVSEASGLIGGDDSPLLRWNPSYLRQHLPKEMKWPVFKAGTGKIVMTHTNRHLTSAELAQLEQSGRRASPDARFRPVSQAMMSFDSFIEKTREHERAIANGEPSEPPYFGCDVLWRNSMDDNGNIQNLGERLKSELLGGANFKSLKALMDAGRLPLMKQVHLFIGSARTLYHCHYDLQPNLHVQLVGSKVRAHLPPRTALESQDARAVRRSSCCPAGSCLQLPLLAGLPPREIVGSSRATPIPRAQRFILFPPTEYARLHPFPVTHDFDRRSQVDLDALDPTAFPGCDQARGVVVELTPGQVLYIPPGVRRAWRLTSKCCPLRPSTHTRSRILMHARSPSPPLPRAFSPRGCAHTHPPPHRRPHMFACGARRVRAPATQWFHHVQTCSSPCVSMAWWFFERTTQQVAAALQAGEPPAATGQRPIDPRAFGISRKAVDLFRTRWAEEAMGKLLAPLDTHTPGTREAALEGVAAGSAHKRRAIARCLLRLGWKAAARLTVSGPCLEADELLGGCSAASALVAADEAREGSLPPFSEGADFESVEDAIWSGIATECDDQRQVDVFLVRLVLLRRYDAQMRWGAA